MTDLFAPAPTDNLLPYNGKVNDLGIIIDDATALYNTLLNELPWQSDIVTLFGKTHITTRQIVWMGDTDADYQYSGHVRQTVPWSDIVFHVKQKIEQALAEVGVTTNFNTCLLNYYPSGADGMGYHADDEKELGHQPVIASLSLGATRKFVFKHKKTQDKVELYLESGQLVVMHGDTQNFWKHTITKTKTVDAGRISLTFRHMLTS
ncbi:MULTISPECIES: alpha-ketoglutarate-dependent dioxygenase AlkB family protein [unclassified Psychrobacter]|uniref:alpha-ketoglutarate-dependent dioxygenase AlkB family protein n=1 Tax=unclassified Psychrobacter TaxID=196806 RepID=UPI00086ED34C|nr:MULTISPECIES: alpha-ketoglutarate-dependent dioxygenase AlkB [unclassified Psychrobacter]OEH67938.1 MAG: DNA repair protein [Psychrobacter sp. B29-1]PKG67086.1 alpha-ketoglutarate-dependent dioxygenase AlkB [Psychrobacter sp. Choline-02u-13]PKH53407.1 alpha-ketoglutarate-dependent dioxygenase AlkB [Psychrobacter sp. Choline-02u-9]|tara:strand:- start:5117 stop:5734 length:618 start_codon:yes stop_codon:yes gene_type:complete